jgi:hypothetical protein
MLVPNYLVILASTEMSLLRSIPHPARSRAVSTTASDLLSARLRAVSATASDPYRIKKQMEVCMFASPESIRAQNAAFHAAHPFFELSKLIWMTVCYRPVAWDGETPVSREQFFSDNQPFFYND